MGKGKKIIGILLIIVSVAALFAWEKWGKDRFIYEEILVLRENVERGTLITAEMLSRVRMNAGEKDCIAPENSQEIIGKEACQFVHRGTPLFKEYFQDRGTVADEKRGEYVMAIPSGWLISSPSTAAKGDRAYFYTGGRFITSAVVIFAGAEDKGYEIIANHKQIETLNRIIDRGNRLVMTYN